MIVYHGSNVIVQKPIVTFSKRFLDFGVGFYITVDKKQAEKWAKRKAVRFKGKPIVNVYNLSNDLAGYKGLVFDKADGLWLNFIVRCRKGNDDYKQYDYISGSVANDDVFVTVDLYVRGIWNEARALSQIKYYETSHQICIINQELINNELIFYDYYEV